MPVDTTDFVYAARPIFRIDDQVENRLQAALMDLMVEETTLGLFRCEARFTNWAPGPDGPFPFFDSQILDFGKEFAVEMGQPGQEQRIFTGRIMGLEAQYSATQPPQIIVLAEDRLQDLSKTRRTRTFNDVSLDNVVQEIAAEYGLQAEVDVDSPHYELLAQLNQSDLAFLRQLATAVDAELWIEENTLHCQARTRRNAGMVQLQYGGNLLEFRVLADLSQQRSSVRASGWDVENKEAIDEEAGEASIAGELDGLRSGSAVLEQALGSRPEQIVSSTPLSRDEAEVEAQAQYRQRARRFVSGTGTAVGPANMRVGSRVELMGLGEYFNGSYYVHFVRHVFNLSDGHRTIFKVERPGLGEPS